MKNYLFQSASYKYEFGNEPPIEEQIKHPRVGAYGYRPKVYVKKIIVFSKLCWAVVGRNKMTSITGKENMMTFDSPQLHTCVSHASVTC